MRKRRKNDIVSDVPEHIVDFEKAMVRDLKTVLKVNDQNQSKTVLRAAKDTS